MSTLKVSNINNESATSGGIQIDSSGSISGALPYPNRNLLYNGAMQVAQRGTSTAGITGSGYHSADRWSIGLVNLGTWTQSVEADGPSGSGFSKSFKMLCTTADASPAASDFLFVNQNLEGQDLQRIAKGTSDAKQLTLSFWVKSNVTGTYVATLNDSDNSRQVAATYTVSASGTWEYKTITFPADTSGVLDNDNASSLGLFFWLGAGTDRTSGTLATTWASTVTANEAAGQTNVAAATNNYWQVTGVQLEVGDTATEFEHLPYGVELARCQRYYWRLFGSTTKAGGFNGAVQASTRADIDIHYPVQMRSSPTVSFTGTPKIDDYYSTITSVTSIDDQYMTDSGGFLVNIVSPTLVQGRPVKYSLGSADYYINFSAEL